MYYDKFRLDNKRVIITGASSGIGRTSCIEAAARGASVILFGRDTTRLEETLVLMESYSAHYLFAADLTDYESIGKIIIDNHEIFKNISGLVNCAGISTTLPLILITPEKLQNFFATNVISAINLIKLITKKSIFDEQGGSIIFLSSVMGTFGEIGKTIYGLTKGALISGAKSLALELAARKIRVNCVSPGVVSTPMSQKAVYSQSEDAIERVKGLHPLGLGQPEDVANLICFLLCDASSWITGTNIFIDGGYSAK